MLGLRLADGLRIENLREQFGEEALRRIWMCLEPYYQKGWVQILSDGELCGRTRPSLPEIGTIKLSDPEGFLFSNVVLVSLFNEFE